MIGNGLNFKSQDNLIKGLNQGVPMAAQEFSSLAERLGLTLINLGKQFFKKLKVYR